MAMDNEEYSEFERILLKFFVTGTSYLYFKAIKYHTTNTNVPKSGEGTIKVLVWPAGIPFLNPMENLWNDNGRDLKTISNMSRPDLLQCLNERERKKRETWLHQCHDTSNVGRAATDYMLRTLKNCANV